MHVFSYNYVHSVAFAVDHTSSALASSRMAVQSFIKLCSSLLVSPPPPPRPSNLRCSSCVRPPGGISSRVLLAICWLRRFAGLVFADGPGSLQTPAASEPRGQQPRSFGTFMYYSLCRYEVVCRIYFFEFSNLPTCLFDLRLLCQRVNSFFVLKGFNGKFEGVYISRSKKGIDSRYIRHYCCARCCATEVAVHEISAGTFAF